MLLKEQPAQLAYALYGSTDGGRPAGHVYPSGSGSDQWARSPSSLAVNTWTHLAFSCDGATARLYVNGTQAATAAISGTAVASPSPLRIGGNTIWNEWYGGLIDEVRIYNRALTAAEIGTDMNTPVAPQDAQAPTAPSNLTATGSLTSAQLNWTGSTDDTGVARYNVHRSTSPGFTPSAANRIAQPTGTSYTDTPSGGTYYYKVTAEDAAGNVSAASNEASATAGDLVAPSAPGTLSAVGAIGKATLTWGAATDNVAVVRYNVHRGDDQRLHAVGREPDRAADRHQLRRRDDPRDLLLQGHGRGRRRQCRRRLERGKRDDHDRHAGADRADRC